MKWEKLIEQQAAERMKIYVSMIQTDFMPMRSGFFSISLSHTPSLFLFALL